MDHAKTRKTHRHLGEQKVSSLTICFNNSAKYDYKRATKKKSQTKTHKEATRIGSKERKKNIRIYLLFNVKVFHSVILFSLSLFSSIKTLLESDRKTNKKKLQNFFTIFLIFSPLFQLFAFLFNIHMYISFSFLFDSRLKNKQKFAKIIKKKSNVFVLMAHVKSER